MAKNAVAVRPKNVSKGNKIPSKPSKAAHAGGDKRKMVWIIAGLSVLLVGLLVEAYFVAKSQASQVIELVHTGPIMDKTIPNTRSLKGDKEGRFIRLNGMNDNWKLQRFSTQLTEMQEYSPKKKEGFLMNARDFAVDADGKIFVLQNDGEVKVLDSDMNYLKSIFVKENDTINLDVDSKGILYVVCYGANKVVKIDQDGNKVGELGTQGSPTGPFTSPVRIVVQPDDRIVLVEAIPAGIRIKAFKPNGTEERSFIIPPEKLHYFEFTGIGVDPQGLIYFNDAAGDHGVVIYDTHRGKSYGYCKSTQDNQAIISPGGLGVNKWTGDIYIDYIPGVMRCRLPAPK